MFIWGIVAGMVTMAILIFGYIIGMIYYYEKEFKKWEQERNQQF